MSIALREVFDVPKEHDLIMHNIMQYCILHKNRKPKSAIRYTCAKITIIRHLVALFRDYLESNSDDVMTLTVFCDAVTIGTVLNILSSLANKQYKFSSNIVINDRINKIIIFHDIYNIISHNVSKFTNIIIKPAMSDITFTNEVIKKIQDCENLIYISTEIGSDSVISSKMFNFEHNFTIPRIVI